MKLIVEPSQLSGTIAIPGSKSHTIRAVVIAALAEGQSILHSPLQSADTAAAIAACRAFGAQIETGETWRITGVGGEVAVPDDVIDVGNSGTTLYVVAATAALAQGYTVFTGDQQIRRRPVETLLMALRDLGSEAFTTRGNGCAPFVVGGPMRGGSTSLRCPTSQYLTALLLNCPLARGDSELTILELSERPYVQMTLDWLNRQGIYYEATGLEHFLIPGGQRYSAFETVIAADFSSATFFLCAGALSSTPLKLTGLDMSDSQGDKAVVDMLRAMGAEIVEEPDGLRVSGGQLRGCELDLNATPDALPALAVVGCFAEGETRLVNVAQARLKETDRIAVMAQELAKLGADLEEQPDGLVIRQSQLQGTAVHGHADHRVVMALTVAGLLAAGETSIDTAEAVAVTFPDFVKLMTSLGAHLRTEE